MWGSLLALLISVLKELGDLLIRTLILLFQGPTLLTSFNLIISLVIPSSNTATLRVQASTCDFGENTNIPCTTVTMKRNSRRGAVVKKSD